MEKKTKIKKEIDSANKLCTIISTGQQSRDLHTEGFPAFYSVRRIPISPSPPGQKHVPTLQLSSHQMISSMTIGVSWPGDEMLISHF